MTFRLTTSGIFYWEIGGMPLAFAIKSTGCQLKHQTLQYW